MTNELTIPQGFGALPSAFVDSVADNDELGQGVSASYAVVGYRGKVWSIKFGGEEKQLMRDDGDGARNSIEVVLVKASPNISKIYYENGWVDGSNAAPDCWSGDGVKPDASVQKKQNPTCADCPMNAWGSRVTEAGKQGKSCADSRRMAVIPINDMANEHFGGPMLLRVPAASLKDLKGYGDMLKSHQFPYFAAVTRISFDTNESFPKFVFTAVRALDSEEAAFVKDLREDKRIGVLLAEKADTAGAGAAATGAAPVAKSPFEVDNVVDASPKTEEPKPAPAKPAAAAPKPAAPKAAAAPKPAAAAAPKPTAPADELAAMRAKLAELEAAAAAANAATAASAGDTVVDGGEETVEEALESFEDALDNILGASE